MLSHISGDNKCTLQVSKAVYASTTKSQLSLTNRKIDEANPSLTYPDMSFAVDNFEEAFESLVCPPYYAWSYNMTVWVRFHA